MPAPPRNILCILAGGQSRRFGSSKLRVHINGEPILAWQVRRLMGAVGKIIPGKAEAWINLAPNERATLPGLATFERFVQDPVLHAGPLVGMLAVLREVNPRDVVTFVPADMPLLEPIHLQSYAKVLAEEPDAVGVMGKWIDGPNEGVIEPFPSLWRGKPAELMLLQLRQHLHGPKSLAAYEGVFSVGLEEARDAEAWVSINYRHDLARISEALGVPVEPEG